MIISITGTPGTGKSVVAKILAKRLKANLIDIRKLIEKEKIPYTWDRKRNTRIVSTIDLKKAVDKKIVKNRTNIVEGHLSHFLKSDFIFILRCDPKELKKRLAKRKWSEEKIKENMSAEILDEITIEALECRKSRKIYEIDTSEKKHQEVAQLIADILKYSSLKRYSRRFEQYKPGNIDWSEKHKKILVKS